MKALDLPLTCLADLTDPYLAELDGRARDAEPLRRQWMQQTGREGDAARHGLARARLGVNLVVQGAHRFAEAELRLAEPDLIAWAEGATPDESAWQLAVVACAWTLIETQLSVRVEPPRERAALALAACAQALREAPDEHLAERIRDLTPWALGTASAWLTLLDEPSACSWQGVYEALQPVLQPALRQGDPVAVDWYLSFATRVGALGRLSGDLRSSLLDAAVQLTGAHALDLPLLTRPTDAARPPRLDALRRALSLPSSEGRPGAGAGAGDGAATGRASPARPQASSTPVDALLRLNRLPQTPADRQRLAAGWMLLAQRMAASARTLPPRLDGAPLRRDATRLRLAAARLWAQDGHWPAVIDALVMAHGQPVPSGSDLQDDWSALVHRLATSADARTARERARRRLGPLRRWLERSVPAPVEPAEEARWLADLATLQGRDAEALALRREALNCAERERGAESLDALLALRALRNTLADRDPGHPELEDLHDTGLQLAQRLCGPMAPEPWWWRGVRALWWHQLGHPQALLDAAEEAEEALPHTVRSGDADTCACLRALVEMARALELPARSEAGRDGRRVRVRVRVQ